MAIRNRKTVADPAGHPKRPHQVEHDRAAGIQQQAEKLTNVIDSKSESYGVENIAKRQRQQLEQQMAELRREAVQARGLARHIDNLSQDAAARKRKSAMTDTSIVDPEHAKHGNRGSGDQPNRAGRQLSFNPLHPSMELPPEQLIRLLGVTGKKTRKQRKKSAHSPTEKHTLTKSTGQTRAKSQQKIRPNPKFEYERNAEPVFKEKHTRLLIPTIAVGAIVGIAAAAWFFWHEPSSPDKAETPGAVSASQPVQQKPRNQPPKRGATPEAKPVVKANDSATPTVSDPAPVQVQVQTGLPSKSTEVPDSAEWTAAVKTKLKDLRRAAEQRLGERLDKIEVMDGLKGSQPMPADNTEPAMTNIPAVETGTVHDERSVADPVSPEYSVRAEAQEISDATQPAPAQPGLDANPERSANREAQPVQATDATGKDLSQAAGDEALF